VSTPVFDDATLAAHFASYFGMDGGNRNAKLWICGIEHGLQASSLSEIIPEPEPGEWDIKKKQSKPYRRWQYWWRISKVVMFARTSVRHTAGLSIDGMTWRTYRDNHLHSKGGWDFKLNLFPLESAHVSSADWVAEHGDQPSLRDKEHYRNLCRDGGRFEFMRQCRETYRPKVILATGVESREDFVAAFGFSGARTSMHFIGPEGKQRRIFVYEHNDATAVTGTLVVVPFFSSASGLNSTGHLEALGKVLARWLTPDDFHELPMYSA
jgi:transcriptional activator of eps genes